MNKIPVVYLGWDPRETAAFDVAEFTLRRAASGPVHVVPLNLSRLEQFGLLRRPRQMRPLNVPRAERMQMWDMISDAPMATEFAISRFLVPALAQTGVAIFMDCDVVVKGDVYELLEQARQQDHLAMWCVQHGPSRIDPVKMDGQMQTTYPRKNWSSVMVFNCDHPANMALGLKEVNTLPGLHLHKFNWLHDRLIGQLDPAWNWLVGVTPPPAEPKIVHMTLGGPWLPGWEPKDHDHIWLEAEAALRAERGASDARGSAPAV